MRKFAQVLNLVVSYGLFGTSVFAQGTLTPPPGAISNGVPVAFMKTMNQIEPRIGISQLPFFINTPGSYYLTKSLIGSSGQDGIIIDSDNVKLNLNGFALSGVPSSLAGIRVVNGPRHNISIRNGVVADWDGDGIDAMIAHESRLIDVTAFANQMDGMKIGQNSLVRECGAFMNGGNGITAEQSSTIKDCKARDNTMTGIFAQFGCKITDSLSGKNGSEGIRVMDYCVVKNCTVAENSGDGIQVRAKCRVVDNNCGNNATAAGVHVTGNGNRIDNNNVTDNLFGILVDDFAGGNLIVRNSASGNTNNFWMGTAANQYGEILSDLTGNFSNSNPWMNFSLPNP